MDSVNGPRILRIAPIADSTIDAEYWDSWPIRAIYHEQYYVRINILPPLWSCTSLRSMSIWIMPVDSEHNGHNMHHLFNSDRIAPRTMFKIYMDCSINRDQLVHRRTFTILWQFVSAWRKSSSLKCDATAAMYNRTVTEMKVTY